MDVVVVLLVLIFLFAVFGGVFVSQFIFFLLVLALCILLIRVIRG